MKKIGIIAGSGILPAIAAKTSIAEGIDTLIYIIKEEDFDQNPFYQELKPIIRQISLTKTKNLFDQLLTDKISHALMVGKVSKEHLFRNLKFDPESLLLIKSMKSKSDNSIFEVILREFQRNKIEIVSQKRFLSSLLLSKRVYTKKEPDKEEWLDIQFGMYYAKKISSMDIGQTIVVKDKTILSVEAMEGTNACILRGGGLLQGKGGVVCKSSREKQDDRFDVPTIGPDTIQVLKESGCHIMAIEANQIFVADAKELIMEADRHGIIFLAVDPPTHFPIHE